MNADPYYLPEGLPTPAPMRDGLDVPFWEAARAHRLVVQRCPSCQSFQWGPEWLCHRCHRFDPEWFEVSASGTVYTWTTVHHPPHPVLAKAVPYIAVVVEIDDADGVRVVGNLLGPSDQPIEIGMPVRGAFEDHDEADPPFTLLQWERASE